MRVLVIGLDSAPPDLVLERWREDLPNLRRLMETGIYGRIESSVPPITVPAWATFATSRNPGRLGFFGFRNRDGHSYTDISIATSRAVGDETVWDIASRAGKRVGLIGVPQTYPPKPVNGFMVTCFLTPSTESQYTYPADLRKDVEALVGDYILDAEDFRTEDKGRLLADIHRMTEQRFTLARSWLTRKPWDFLMMVEMGPDRIQHGFWKYFDPQHRKHVPGSPFQNALLDYYRFIDARIGELLELVGDDTAVMVVSDHGAKRMEGAVNINDWLIREGYLKLRSQPGGVIPFNKADVDWANTRAWGWGGYHGRVFLNVAGREAQGVIPPSEYENVQDELAAKLEAIPDDAGRPMATQVLKPKDVYTGPYVDRSPDLVVYFGDLCWRATEDVGHDSIYSFETERGPDDAVHDRYGMLILRWPGCPAGVEVQGARLLDGAPTLLDLLGLPVPADMEGKSLVASNLLAEADHESF